MTDESRTQSLELREKIELEVRRLYSTEGTQFGEKLEKQFKLIAGGISVILTVALAAFFYFVHDTKKELKTELAQQVSQNVLAYKINEDLKARVEALAKG